MDNIETTILFSYIRESATPEERKQVEAWLDADENNERELLQLAKLYYAQQTQERIRQRDARAAFETVEKRIRSRKRRLFVRRIGVAAAVLALLVASTFWVQEYWNKPARQYAFQTDAARCTEFTLPDGTQVFLNAYSSLTYTDDFGQKTRDVSLDGEGYFKVKKDKDKPFIVNSFDRKARVRVLGTTFNVQAYSKDRVLQTTLLEGSVNLETLNGAGETRQQLMLPSERITVHLVTDEIVKETIDPNDIISWMDDRLVFRETPLPEVARRLASYYGVKIDIRDKAIQDYVFTGTFEQKPLKQVLEYMKIASSIDYQLETAAATEGKSTITLMIQD